MSHEAVTWAMYDAPRLMNEAGKPDVTARTVLVVLAERARPDGSNAFPGAGLIGDVTGLDDTTIRRAMRRLEDAKLIERDGARPSGAVVWRLNLSLRRADSHREGQAELSRARRAATAERMRRYRAEKAKRDAAEAGDSAADVTGAGPVTRDVADADVTGPVPSRDGRCARDVTGAVPPEPVKEPPHGTGGRAAAPQTPADSTTGLGSVGGSSTTELDHNGYVSDARARRGDRRSHLKVVGDPR